jgi:hypothetical protein
MIPPVQNLGPEAEMRDRNVFVFKIRTRDGTRINTRSSI